MLIRCTCRQSFIWLLLDWQPFLSLCSRQWSADGCSAGHLSSGSDIHVQAWHCINSVCQPYRCWCYDKGRLFALYLSKNSLCLYTFGVVLFDCSAVAFIQRPIFSELPRLVQEHRGSAREKTLSVIWHCQCTQWIYIICSSVQPSVLWRCWLGGRKGIWPVKILVMVCWRC